VAGPPALSDLGCRVAPAAGYPDSSRVVPAPVTGGYGAAHGPRSGPPEQCLLLAGQIGGEGAHRRPVGECRQELPRSGCGIVLGVQVRQEGVHEGGQPHGRVPAHSHSRRANGQLDQTAETGEYRPAASVEAH
jgi:hypothetical protein